jgi:hypothetical protein
MDVTEIRNRGRRDVCLFVNFIGVTILKHRMTALCPPVAEKGGESGGEKGVRKI